MLFLSKKKFVRVRKVVQSQMTNVTNLKNTEQKTLNGEHVSGGERKINLSFVCMHWAECVQKIKDVIFRLGFTLLQTLSS